ncbi:MAG: hypothetical protein V4582_11835 [Pseudomonadota bacterium]
MKLPLFILLAVLGPAAGAAEECSFNQEPQVEVLKKVAARYPGGKVVLASRQVSWNEGKGKTTTFGYGGCYDFGSVISQSEKAAAPRSEAQVFALAKALAQRFWNKDIYGNPMALETLTKNLDDKHFTARPSHGSTVYRIEEPLFAELSVAHTFARGYDRVVLTWQGNF